MYKPTKVDPEDGLDIVHFSSTVHMHNQQCTFTIVKDIIRAYVPLYGCWDAVYNQATSLITYERDDTRLGGIDRSKFELLSTLDSIVTAKRARA